MLTMIDLRMPKDPNTGTRYSWPWWVTLAALVALFSAYALHGGHDFIFGPRVIETGDFAANGLQIANAARFHEIYGNYSRWGFNHPGPFFFYIYALGEGIFFNALHWVNSPHQAHIIAGIILQSMFVAGTLLIFSRLSREVSTLFVWLLCAAAIFPYVGSELSSIWPPHVLLGPYLFLIATCIAVGMGQKSYLPLAVLATCVLCHGHVAQPLMTLPMLAVALLLYVQTARARGLSIKELIRETSPQIALSVAAIALFVAPILVDLYQCPECNAHRVLGYIHSNHDKKPRWGQAFNYVFSYFVLDHKPEWLDTYRGIGLFKGRVLFGLALLGMLVCAPHILGTRIDELQRRFLKTAAIFTLLATVLSLFWARRITGPLYEFNAYFIYGIFYVVISTLITALHFAFNKLWRGLGFNAAMSAIAIALSVHAPPLQVFSQPYVLQDPSRINSPSNSLAIINQSEGGDWPATTALALKLVRSDNDFAVPKHWTYVFGQSHGLDGDKLASTLFTIWEPWHDQLMLAHGSFDYGAFCQITPATQAADFSVQPMPLDSQRSHCLLTAVGLAHPSKHLDWQWTDGSLLAFQFVGRHAEGPVTIRLDAIPFLADGKLKQQRVHLYVNGNDQGIQVMRSAGQLSFIVSANVWDASPVITVAFHLPDAASPSSLGLSGDTRVIGLGFKGLEVYYQ